MSINTELLLRTCVAALLGYAIFYTPIMSRLMDLPNRLFSNREFNNRNSTFDSTYKRRLKTALKNGGYPGGLANDGNTCFMNSVIQCLASSQLVEYLESYTVSNDASEKNEEKSTFFKHINSKENGSKVAFSNALVELLQLVNRDHGEKCLTYNTKKILKVMKDSPNKHLFLGYNQEDAQEFYQNLMKQVEKEYIDITNIPKDKEYVDLNKDSITGLNQLGNLGDVYVPVSHIDPADDDNAQKFKKYRLVTPVDGLQCDRIGCMNCGEMGGIRYSVTSGLALNIPMEGASRNRFTLDELIAEFCKREIIDDVECNRCSLKAIQESLIKKLTVLKDNATHMKGSTLLIEKIEERIVELTGVLEKKSIHDDIYEKLHTKNMVQKSRKVKQSYLSRPPSLLCVHINRSVFDPRTYMVRKNNAKIDFPMTLDMSNYIASDDNINLDARLPMRGGNLTNIKYKLKSLISHFGTHNYGHYIAFRKHKGNWWHISDETVILSSEREVLDSQGTFMLFYALCNGDEDDEEEDAVGDNEEEKEKYDGDDETDESGNVDNGTDLPEHSSDISDAQSAASTDSESTVNEDQEERKAEIMANIQANL